MARALSIPLALRLGSAVLVHLSAAAVLDRRGNAATATSEDEPKPNILYFLLDDFGWGDAGWHWPSGANPYGLKTPFLTKYAREEGLELDRHYAHQFCSPTRSAIQTGRNPLKVNVRNLTPDWWNPDDPVSGFAGVPTEMTFIAEKLRDAGYETHIYGKWDIGATSAKQLPEAHGYDHSLVYFGHGNAQWTFTGGECPGKVELWCGDHGASDAISNLKDPSQCSQEMQDGCTFQEAVFAERVKTAIMKQTKPFFIFWSTHLVHGPYAVPQNYTKAWKDKAFIDSDPMLLFYGMVDYLDMMFGDMMDLLKEQGKWDNTLVIVHSDNGAPVSLGHAGNNWPLRGGKVSNWEGGVRVPAFVTGGWLPENRRGKKSESFITAWDWYHTLTALVGAGIDDPRAKAANLPDISDSVNQLPMLLGQGSQRTSIYLGQLAQDSVAVSVFIKDQYKILLGALPENVTTGEAGGSQAFRENMEWSEHVALCGDTPATGCLFDIFEDITESINLASTKEDVFHQMLSSLQAFNHTFGPPFNPNRGTAHEEFCSLSESLHGSFIGPVKGFPSA